MLDSSEPGPVNLGNPDELAVHHLAELIIALTGSPSSATVCPTSIDDPTRRKTVIERAAERLVWKPSIPIEAGLQRRSIGSASSPAK